MIVLPDNLFKSITSALLTTSSSSVILPSINDCLSLAAWYSAEYHAAKDKQSFIEGRITELEDVVSRAEVIDLNKLSGKTITFGTKIKIVDEETDQETDYQIVGPYEANLELGLISIASPIAKALIGKEKGLSLIHI